MDQRELHALEARCIHDAPPPCVADCPLGVDARGVLEAVAAEGFDKGLQLFTTRALLPGLLCRVCEEPCRHACPRETTGGSLQLRELEAACVTYGSETTLRRVPPRRGTAVVVGGGLTGMTAGLDLALRGYGVRLIEAIGHLGGRLRGDGRVSDEALAAAVTRLEKAGVRLELGHAVDASELAAIAEEASAICLDCAGLNLPLADRVVVVDAGCDAFVAAAAAGRRAAAAADLRLRGVPAPAQTVTPGPALPPGFGAGEPPRPAVSPTSAGGFTRGEAAKEGARCLRCACRECIDACPFLNSSASSPKALLREINNNLVVTPGMGYRASKAVINGCRLCGLCAEVCPADINFGEICREARRGLHKQGAMPPAVHEALLRDVAASNGPRFALARPQPGTTSSRFALFPGCQLPASRPQVTKAAYEFLTSRLDGGVGLLLGCCGAPTVWAGRDDEAAAALDAVGRAWESLGRPTLVTACPSCLRTLVEVRPDIVQRSLWEVLAGLEPALFADASLERRQWPPLAVHDPCAARYDEASRAAARRLLDAAGVDHRDLPRSGRVTECCGFGGLQKVAAPDLAAATLERQIAADARDFATTCAMCRDQFAAAGKPAWHLLDVLFGGAYSDSDGGARRPALDEAARLRVSEKAAPAEGISGRGPTWSARRAARERFAREILRDLWGEEAGGEPASAPAVLFSPAARSDLDAAFVLESDIAAVVAAGEAGGPRFCSRESGRFFAHGRRGSVTYWAVCERRPDGPEVCTVYSHRMEVLGAVAEAPGAGGLPSAGSTPGVICDICGVDLTLRPVRLTYLGMTFDVELPACPSCGEVFVDEEVATGRMREVEMSLEDK